MSAPIPEIGSGHPNAAEVEPPAAVSHAGGSIDQGMGVTANAILLLGNVLGRFIEAPDRLYQVERIEAADGALIIRRRGTENIHRISIVQLEGIE